MQIRKCDFCDEQIDKNDGVSFGIHDLCESCIKLIRGAIQDCAKNSRKVSENSPVEDK